MKFWSGSSKTKASWRRAKKLFTNPKNLLTDYVLAKFQQISCGFKKTVEKQMFHTLLKNAAQSEFAHKFFCSNQ